VLGAGLQGLKYATLTCELKRH